jgi:hypothetical protein
MIDLKKVWDYILRHSIWFLGGVVALYLAHFATEKIATILDVLTYEALAIGLSAIALYAFTHIKWTVITEAESTLGKHIVMGIVFFAVHILVAIIVIGTFFINNDKAMVELEKKNVVDSVKVVTPHSDTVFIKK